MSTDKERRVERWPAEYARLLEQYAEQPSDDLLRQAGMLGSRLVEVGVAPHEAAATHTDVVARLCKQRVFEAARILRVARPLLVELMGGYGAADRRQPELDQHDYDTLRRSEAKFRSLTENAPNTIVLVDRDGIINFINHTVPDTTPEKVVGTSIYDYIVPEFHAVARDTIEHVFRTGEAGGYESVATGPGTGPSWYDTQVGAVTLDGQVTAATLFVTDTTARKRAEQALRESERKLRALFDQTFQLIGLMTPDGTLIECNRTALKFAGIEAAEVLGKPFWETPWWSYSSESQDRLRQAIRQAADGQFVRFEVTHPAADGSFHYVDFSLKPVLDDAGKVSLLIPEGRDITDRKRAEREMQEFKTISDRANYGVAMCDLHGNFTYVNNAFAKMHGYTAEEVIGRHLSVFHSKEQMRHISGLDDLLKREGGFSACEVWHRRVDGSVFPMLMNATVIKDHNGIPSYLSVTAVDITERKQAESALRRQALVFENMFDAVIVADPNHCIVDWNPAASRIFGYERSEVLGRTPEMLAAPGGSPSRYKVVVAAMERDGHWSGEQRFVRRDGREGYCEATMVVLRDERQAVIGNVAVVHDITDRVRAEEEVRQREQDLAHVTRLATVGEMATGLAHELNQPLSAILYYARGCVRRLRAGEYRSGEILEVLEKVGAQAERAAAFVDRIRAFVRKAELRLAAVDLNQAVREAASFAAHEARQSGTEINFELAASLPPVQADMMQVEQVVLNLLRNGIEAVQDCDPDRRRVTVRTGCADGMVFCAISDTGCGCSEEVAEQLFDAFFTTKPEGLGMGLTISGSIVQAHGGRVWATPNPGGGTTFRFTLPVLERGVGS